MKWLPAALVLALALVLGACNIAPPAPETSTTTPPKIEATALPAPPATAVPSPSTPSPAPTVQLAPASPTPWALPSPVDRDLYELTGRLRLRSATPIPTALPGAARSRQVGEQETFWLTDFDSYKHFTATATLKIVGPHTYFYVQDGVNLDAGALQRSADEFEQKIYPSLHRYIGEERKVGVDNDARLVVLNARIPGVAGYFSVADEYPKVVNPFSNERQMIYINVNQLQPGTQAYHTVLAHEFTHTIHWNVHPNEEAWVSEGTAELGAMLAAEHPGYNTSFRQQPDTQLTTWAELPADSGPHYGAAQLFMTYLTQHYGGYDRLKEILAEKPDGVDGINAYLKKAGYSADFDAVFRDWVVANYLDGAGVDRYDYRDLDVRVSAVTDLAPAGVITGTVHQYAARYYRLLPGNGKRARIAFDGDRDVRLIPNSPHSGRYQWWSNRGDATDTTLTRELDLTGVSKATLRFWVWYRIEENWDYAYVEASDDGGKSWQILSTPTMRTTNPLGNSLGPGYTGMSGGGKAPAWVEESVDLSAFAGKRVLVRFEYVTDEAFNDVGFAVDDVSVPEVGYRDDAEADGGWTARGFARVENSLGQRFSVQLVRVAQPPAVEPLALDANRHGEAVVDGEAVLVVAGLTPVTTETAGFRLAVEQAP